MGIPSKRRNLVRAVRRADRPVSATNPHWIEVDEVRSIFSQETSESWAATMARMDFQEPGLVKTSLEWALRGAILEEPILDAGCGTGLCAPLIGGFSRRLEGVDLSENMLDAARKTGHYDALHCAELVSFLEAHQGYGAIAGSSVCIYLSDLRPLFAAVKRALVKGGVFVFTVDLHDGVEEVVVSPRHHGMRLHNPKHMLLAAWQDGLELLRFERCRMRNDFFELQPIEGAVVVLRKAGGTDGSV
jgi:predicted TPR repeat methyltransferase